MTSDFDE